ncbi:MAG: S-layer homology domain-containing protein [Quinella sp. 2Q5]|nr:S-layer homology domain-containing protein [Quinella sp. 2Q5]
MKKSVAAALAAAAVIGVSSTSFAAIANPFTDVPAGHWAYQSIEKLRVAGVIDGYTDEYGRPNSLFRGDRNITRYEAAQMIARALAKNPTGANKAELDRLVAEFRDELDALGVRVDNLEKYGDKVIWQGKLEYTYRQNKRDPLNTGHKAKDTSNGYVFRFEPIAEVNDHWTLRARIDATGDMRYDTTTDFNLVRGWAQGDYDKFQIKLGRMELNPAGEFGLIWDTQLSGAQVTFGSKWKFTANAGRLRDDKVGGGINGSFVTTADPGTMVGLRVDYDQGNKGLFGGAGWYHLKDDDLAWGRRQFVENFFLTGNTDAKKYNKADIWTVNLGYKFSDRLMLRGAYARNTKADVEKNSWQAELRYGDYGQSVSRTGDWRDRSLKVAKGQWAVWAGYRKFGTNATMAGTVNDDAMGGTHGFVAGASWAPFDNIGLIAKYFTGKYNTAVDGGHGKAQRFFGRVEFFF